MTANQIPRVQQVKGLHQAAGCLWRGGPWYLQEGNKLQSPVPIQSCDATASLDHAHESVTVNTPLRFVSPVPLRTAVSNVPEIDSRKRKKMNRVIHRVWGRESVSWSIERSVVDLPRT